MISEIMKVFQPFKGEPIANYDIPSSMNVLNEGKFEQNEVKPEQQVPFKV